MTARRCGQRTTWLRRDDGNAVAGFALVAPLVLAVSLAVLQVILTVHVRTTLTSAAAEGARAAARAGASLEHGEARALDLARRSLAGGLVDGVVARRELADGLPVTAVEMTAQLPLLGMLAPMGMTVVGRALTEAA